MKPIDNSGINQIVSEIKELAKKLEERDIEKKTYKGTETYVGEEGGNSDV